MTTLGERDRELIALRYGADLTARQIGELLGLQTNAVEVALHRALQTLCGSARATGRRRAARRESARREGGRVTAGTIARVGAESLSRHGEWWTSAAVLLLPFVAVVGIAAASGGFNATSFGWTALAFAWIVIVAVALAVPAWGRFDVAWLTAAAADLPLHLRLGALVELGRHRGEQRPALARVPHRRSQPRLLVVRRGRLSLWLGGLALGAAGVSRLLARDAALSRPLRCVQRSRRLPPLRADRLLERARHLRGDRSADRVRGRGRRTRARASRPHGDRAGSAHLDAVLHLQPRRDCWRSRFGLLAVFALSPQRLRLLGGLFVLAPIPAVGVLLASRASALTHQSVAVSAAAHAGHRLALELALLAAAQAVVAAVYVVWLSRVRVGETTRRAAGAGAVASSLVALIGVFAVYGSPPTLARHAYHSFVSTPTGGTDLNSRLFSLSNNGRTVLWRSALDDFRAHPVVGSGAGSFGRWWLAHRTSAYFVEDAHNLYVQTLGRGRSHRARAARRAARDPVRCSGPRATTPARCARLRCATSRFSSTRPSTGTGRCRP